MLGYLQWTLLQEVPNQGIFFGEVESYSQINLIHKKIAKTIFFSTEKY